MKQLMAAFSTMWAMKSLNKCVKLLFHDCAYLGVLEQAHEQKITGVAVEVWNNEQIFWSQDFPDTVSANTKMIAYDSMKQICRIFSSCTQGASISRILYVQVGHIRIHVWLQTLAWCYVICPLFEPGDFCSSSTCPIWFNEYPRYSTFPFNYNWSLPCLWKSADTC